MTSPSSRGEAERDRVNRIRRDESASVRDISGDYPRRTAQKQRKACERDFRLFCETYFPNAFHLAWSDDHLKVIEAIERSVLKSGLLALAMPRGSGKTALCVRAALWALLYGHRRFICLIAATEDLAQKLMEPIKTELCFNELLYRPFRQVTYPIGRLENNGRRCIGQTFGGEQTRITWGADRLVFPTMPKRAWDGMDVSGSCVTVAGLTGAIRGQSSTLADGRIIRPELVLLDDPQTRESAMSPAQSEARESIIKGDVLGMAGPGMKISALMPCTVIRQGDMADRMLDRSRNPQWSGQRTKMIYSFPESKLWDEYGRIYKEALYNEKDPVDALAFYRANQAIMDEGGVVAWPARKYPDDVSALQHAMTLKLLDERMFFCEYQNDPLPEQVAAQDDLTHGQIAGKVNRMARKLVPLAGQRVTAFIDVQGEALYYIVAAWEENFTGYVVDYGVFPDQKSAYFTLRDAKHPLSGAFPGRGLEGCIYAGLEALCELILGRDWVRDDGASLHVERCLVDANWGSSTKTVYEFCRQSRFSAVLLPSHGKYIGAANIPMSEYHHEDGAKKGFNWRITLDRERRPTRRVIFDANFWKSFIRARLATGLGDPGCLSLFGDNPALHRLFADHLTAEYRIKTIGRGRECDEWKQNPGRPDNHWLDCLVGATVAASMQGVSLEASGGLRAPRAAKKLVSFADQWRQKRLADQGYRPGTG
jgi:hypothetical protein